MIPANNFWNIFTNLCFIQITLLYMIYNLNHHRVTMIMLSKGNVIIHAFLSMMDKKPFIFVIITYLVITL